jgi:hypothetical protein
MALLFCDGMDAYAVVGDLPRKGWQGGNGTTTISTWVIDLTGGAFGGPAVSLPPQDSNRAISHYNTFTYADGYTLNVAYYFKQVGLPSINTGNSVVNASGLLTLSSDTATAADNFTLLAPSTAGFLQAYAYNSGTVAATGTHNVCDGNYHWIEIQYVLTATTTGSIKIYVDGVLDITVTGIKTMTAVPAPTGAFGLGAGANNGSRVCSNWYDDVIVWDNTGANFNTFPLGQQRIATINPNAAGDLAQFTPSAGANNAVAAQAYAGTATLTSIVAGQTDLYGNSGMGGFAPSTITAVVANLYASSPNAVGGFKVTPQVKSSGTVVSGTPSLALTATAATSQAPFFADSTGAAWTPTSVAAAQIGMGS